MSWSGKNIPWFRDTVAGVCFLSSASILRAAVGGNFSSKGDNFGICGECAASFKFPESVRGGFTRGLRQSIPMWRKITQRLGENASCKPCSRERSMFTVHVHATAAAHGPCRSGTRPLCTGVVPRCALLVYKMDRIPLWPVGPIRSSRRNGLRDGQRSSRHQHRTRTGFRHIDAPLPNTLTARPK